MTVRSTSSRRPAPLAPTAGVSSALLLGLVLTGVGMSLTVAPLTTSVLAAVRPEEVGVASGVNNTMARVGTLLAVAIIGVVALALYGAALERRLAAASVPVECPSLQ